MSGYKGDRALNSGAIIIRVAALAAMGIGLSACSMGGMFGGGAQPSAQTQALQNATATPAQIAAMSPALPAIATECPPIKVRPGAEAVYYYGKGQVGNPKDLQYQAIIDKQGRLWIVGDPAGVVAAIRAQAEAAGADEVMVTTTMWSHQLRLRSYRLLAEAWGL